MQKKLDTLNRWLLVPAAIAVVWTLGSLFAYSWTHPELTAMQVFQQMPNAWWWLL